MDTDFLLFAALNFNQLTQQLIKTAYIKKMPNGKYRVLSQKGKNLGTFKSLKEAKKHLKRVEYFKYLKSRGLMKSASKELDLSDIEAFTYSSIMRQINKQLDQQAAKHFAKIFKQKFDKCVLDKEPNIDEKCLKFTVQEFSKKYPIKSEDKNVKTASDLGSTATVGKYIANIIRFNLNRLPADKRSANANRIKEKLSRLHSTEIAAKKMPASATIGQSINFIKHILSGQNPAYVKEVINHTIRSL